MKYKLLIVDVDGTLVNKSGKISARDKDAISRARRAGVTVSLSTGRVIKACLWIVRELSLDGCHIFFDGAFVGTPGGGEVYVRSVLREQVREMVRFARLNNIYLELYSATDYFVERETWGTRVHHDFFGLEPTVVNFDGIWDRQRIIKGELFTSSPGGEAQAKDFEREFAGRLRFSWAATPAFPGVHFVNVVDPEVSKGTALEALASYLEVPLEQAMAVGDGVNDIPLLAAAGLALAMGNSPPELISVADHVTLDVEHSGLAAAVDGFLLSDGASRITQESNL